VRSLHAPGVWCRRSTTLLAVTLRRPALRLALRCRPPHVHLRLHVLYQGILYSALGQSGLVADVASHIF
jgi:hypothetical protein